MSDFPRLAIGAYRVPHTPQPPIAGPRLVAWGLAHALARGGRQVQLFRGDARQECCAAERIASGVAIWQLDSWLMSPATCRELFALGCRGRDLALVEGAYGAGPDSPSDLSELARWLGLPAVVVLDARALGGCGLPPPPPVLDAVFLDQVADAAEYCQMAANVEALWGVPVLGGLEQLAAARARLAAGPPGCPAWREALSAVSASLEQLTDLARIERFASRTLAPAELAATEPAPVYDRLPGLRIAVAYDEAFGGYCQDMLELLEQRGAQVQDFSPLRDERLPDACDLVYLGCGRIEQHIKTLAANTCMLLALHKHVRAGRRVLAEGAGLAYACAQLEDAQGRRHSMAGLLPAFAWSRGRASHVPLETRLKRDCWLGPSGTWLRGYACERWAVEPATRACQPLLAAPEHERALLAAGPVLGSQLQLHYAARPDLLRAFFAPHHAVSTAAAAAS